MKCKFQNRLNKFLDDELKPEEKANMQEHLKSCSACQEELRKIQHVNNILGSYREIEVSSDLINRVLDKIPEQKNYVFNRKVINFSVAASILFSFFSGLWLSNKVYVNQQSSTYSYEIGEESLYSYLDWEE